MAEDVNTKTQTQGEQNESEYTGGNRKLVVKQAEFSCWGSAVNLLFLKVLLFWEGSRLNHIAQIPFIVHIRCVEWPVDLWRACVFEGSSQIEWEKIYIKSVQSAMSKSLEKWGGL